MYKLIKNHNSITLSLAKMLAALLLILSIIGISAAIIGMLFGKPIGDDYGGIATFKLNRAWINEAVGSLMMTGRYGQSLTSSIVYGLFGNNIPVFLPLITLIWFIILVFLYIRKVIKKYTTNRQTEIIYSVIGALVLTFLVLFVNNTPQTINQPVWASFQDFFWPSGIITYTIPLLILLSGLYIIFLTSTGGQLQFRKKALAWGAVVFLSCLFNEVQPVFLVVASLLLIIATYINYYKFAEQFRSLFVITATASIAALVTLYFSPGRMVRSQAIDATAQPVQGSLIEAINRNSHLLIRDLYLQPREIVLLLLGGIVVAFIAYSTINNKKTFREITARLLSFSVIGVIFCALALIISMALVGVGYGVSAGVYSRTLILAQVIYVLSFTLLAFSLSGILISKISKKNKYIPGAIVGIIGLLFIVSLPNYFGKILSQVNSSVTYSNAWIEQDTMLRNAAGDGKRETLYLVDPANGIGDGFSLTCTGPYAGSTMWLNELISKYYGSQDKICAKE